jgi:segregation and condensation protein A
VTIDADPFDQHEIRHLRPDQLVLDLDGFEGPIDLLLALARDQKVDLAKISILELADQYLAFVAAARRIRLELAADYLVMAAWLAYLKSRLLVPEPEGRRARVDASLKGFDTAFTGLTRAYAVPAEAVAAPQ